MLDYIAWAFKINPFIFVVVVLQVSAFFYALYTGDYKPGVLMLVYGVGNGIIAWWK